MFVISVVRYFPLVTEENHYEPSRGSKKPSRLKKSSSRKSEALPLNSNFSVPEDTEAKLRKFLTNRRNKELPGFGEIRDVTDGGIAGSTMGCSF